MRTGRMDSRQLGRISPTSEPDSWLEYDLYRQDLVCFERLHQLLLACPAR